jgi:hypothetical protein
MTNIRMTTVNSSSSYIVTDGQSANSSWCQAQELMALFYCLNEAPPTWRARSPYLHPPGTGWHSYTTGHWVTVLSINITQTLKINRPVLSSERALQNKKPNYLKKNFKEKEKWSRVPDGCLTPRTGRLTVGRNITLALWNNFVTMTLIWQNTF